MDEPGTVAALTSGNTGELLTLQRAAFVTEAKAHQGLHIPAKVTPHWPGAASSRLGCS